MSKTSLALLPAPRRAPATSGFLAARIGMPTVDAAADGLVDDLCQASCDAASALRALRTPGASRASALRTYRRVLERLNEAQVKAQVLVWAAGTKPARQKPLALGG
jgi:hypothetical protein